MASNTMYVDLDGASQSKKNSKTVRYIIGGFAAGVMLGAAVNMLNSSNSVAPEMAVGASGPIELSVGTSPFMSMLRATRAKSPAASVVVRGGAYLPPQAKPYFDNYLGKWKGGASGTSQYSSPTSQFSSPGGKVLTADEIEFMERQARRAAMPAPAPREYKDTHGRTRILER
eukprot:gnl/TRDRNA2_/TRDRNA2_177231_c0_seq3.p1 gnl/TRDRNA2_/TRDRNA2_177231_c0~~gnl/TRDRNA2_/TRDRNA2_177231_c0_seq3.p1  ORF type:complete len:172 (+),score=14.93 gnl/TRDRNA2_/TRDRNA2_177231_c0_seq3:71-586(+)